MKKTAIFVLVFFAVAIIGLAPVSFSQEDDVSYASGEVISVKGSSITINEVIYDEEMDEESFEEVTYTFSEDIDVENAPSAGDIAAGQEVDIEFIETSDGKEAVYIYVYSEEE